MISKEKIAVFRKFLLHYIEECPCNDTELAFLHDKLFGLDRGYRIIAGGKMKAIGDTIAWLKEDVERDNIKTLEELIAHHEKDWERMSRSFKAIETMTAAQQAEYLRLRKDQVRDKFNRGI